MKSKAVLDKLREFDTPTICNLIELFDVRPRTAGYMNERIKLQFPEMTRPVVGFASPVTVRSATSAGAQGSPAVAFRARSAVAVMRPP